MTCGVRAGLAERLASGPGTRSILMDNDRVVYEIEDTSGSRRAGVEFGGMRAAHPFCPENLG